MYVDTDSQILKEHIEYRTSGNIMKFFIRHLLPVIVLFISVLLLSGCGQAINNAGKISNKLHHQAISETGKKEAWKTEDLSVHYSINKNGSIAEIDASIQLSNKITQGFPLGKYLNVYINFIDNNNTVITTHDVSPLIGYLDYYEHELKLLNIPPIPENAMAFTISYWGSFRDTSVNEGTTIEWEVYFNPIKEENSGSDSW